MIFCAVLVVGLVSVFMIRNSRQALEEGRVQFVADHLSDMTANKLDMIHNEMTRMAENPVVLQYATKFQEQVLVQFFVEQSKIFPDIRFVAADGYEEVRVKDGHALGTETRYEGDVMLARCRELPGRTLVDPMLYSGPDGYSLRLLFGIKRYFGGLYVGTIVAYYPLSRLQKVLKMPGVGGDDLNLIVDLEGQVLASSSGKLIGKPVFDPLKTKSLLEAARKKRHLMIRDRLFEVDSFCVLQPLDINPWTIVVSTPYAGFVAESNRIRNYYLIILVVMGVLGSVMVYTLANRIIGPLLELSRQAVRVVGGHAQRLNVTSDDEVGTLVNSFNTMVADLTQTTVSKEYLVRIIDTINDLLVVIDSRGRLTRVNRKVAVDLGYSYEEMLGMHLRDIIVGYPQGDLPWFFAMPELTEQAGGLDKELRKRNGETISVLLTSSVLRDPENNPTGAVLVAHDISDRIEAEQKLAHFAKQLQESNQELEEFAYIASHDLKEPLRKVTAFGERLKMKFGDLLGEQGVDYLARMESAATRMQRLIDDLLNFSRVKTKARPFEPVDLNNIYTEVLSDLETRIEETGGKVTCQGLLVIDADPMQMRQLFQNLIGNGLKFNRPGVAPQLDIRGEILENNWYRLTFTDNGIGFDEKYQEKIFGVFQRLHGREEYEGTGIGLSICRKIAKRHGGDISAAGTLGAGAEFTVTLRRVQSKEPEGHAG